MCKVGMSYLRGQAGEVETGRLLMTQRDRDRLVALKKAKRKLMTQREAAEEIGQTERHVRRLLVKLRKKGDAAVVHALRGQSSNRKLDEKIKTKAMAMLRQEVYRGFGPTLASEYLAQQRQITVSRETVRAWMIEARLWHAARGRVKEIHVWRERRSRFGELVQWDSSEHDWLEGRGPKLYLLAMLDDATSRALARFAEHDTTEENFRLLESYLRQWGRPGDFYTDQDSMFTVNRPARETDEEAWPEAWTQIGRALKELGAGWIGAHSPQAKGRIERFFGTAQDRLVKGLRQAGARSGEEANTYLEQEYLPMWNRRFTAEAENATDAHRPLRAEHNLAAILSHVEERVVGNDYTIRYNTKIYQIPRTDIRPGLGGAPVRAGSRAEPARPFRLGPPHLDASAGNSGQHLDERLPSARESPAMENYEARTGSGKGQRKHPLTRAVGANLSRPTGSFGQRPQELLTLLRTGTSYFALTEKINSHFQES